MPTLKPRYAGTTWRYHGVYYVDGVETSLTGASLVATLKRSNDDTDASAVAQITTAPAVAGQITLDDGPGGVTDSQWTANFAPAATAMLMDELPLDADLWMDLRVQEADTDEWIPLPENPDEPVRIPVRMPTTRAS